MFASSAAQLERKEIAMKKPSTYLITVKSAHRWRLRLYSVFIAYFPCVPAAQPNSQTVLLLSARYRSGPRS